MKTKTVTEQEFEISDTELMGIILRYLAANKGIKLSAEDYSRISIDRDKVTVTVTKREYKKG